jgi:hypothetical protein
VPFRFRSAVNAEREFVFVAQGDGESFPRHRLSRKEAALLENEADEKIDPGRRFEAELSDAPVVPG